MIKRIELWMALALLAASQTQAQTPPAGPRTRLTCDVQRQQQLSFIDHPMAPAGVNRRVTTREDAPGGRFELSFPSNSTEATLTVGGALRDGGRPATVRMNRYTASEYTGFNGIDADDGSTHLVTYFARINKAILTIHAPRAEGRDRAAVSRSLFADCRRDEQR